MRKSHLMRSSSPGARAGAALLLIPLVLGCARAEAPPPAAEPPAHLEALAEDESRHRITLTERAAERLGIQVTEARIAPGVGGPVWVPYSSIIYDADGSAWAYVVEGPLVFVRQPVTVAEVHPDEAGGLAVLSDGIEAGTTVVSVGVAELFGTEFEVGH